MSLHPLHLTPDPATRDSQAAAFWLPVSDRGAWIDGLRRLGPGARAFVLPRAADDLRPGGAVLVPAAACAAGALPWQACTKAWGRLLMPAGHRLEPALTPAEAQRFFSCELSFFHPSLGVVGFAAADAMGLGDLLVPPPRLVGDPTLAREGAAPLPQLGRMALRVPPKVEELLAQGGEGIGEKPPTALNPLRDPGTSFREKAKEALLQMRDGLRGKNPKFRRAFLWTLVGVVGALLLTWLVWWIATSMAAPSHPMPMPKAAAPPPVPPPSAPSHAPPAHPPAARGPSLTQMAATLAGWLAVILGCVVSVMLGLMFGSTLVAFVRRFFRAWKIILMAAVIVGVIAVLVVLSESKAFPPGAILPIVMIIGFLIKAFGGSSAPAPPPAPAQAAAPAGPPPLADIQDAREREIERLLALLEKNPEEGLRYALPLGGEFVGRGAAAPSTRLGLRDLALTLGGGGGGPVDSWRPRVDQQWRLQQKYREQANRAIAEGNCERAAYIHAKLLGDWRGAASALEQGKLWQKAAQLYDEKLHDTYNAARCLEKAGQLEEAAARYAKVLQHEKAGDLWDKLGRHGQAREAWRAAAARARTTPEKARILFEKLGEHEAALALLEAAWPGSSEAAACLDLHWKYLRRLEWRDARLALAGRLRREKSARLPAPERMLAMLEAWRMAEGEADVAAALEDASWTVAGEALAEDPTRLCAREILGRVPGLAREDKVLAEDARRFLARGTQAPDPAPRAKEGMIWSQKGNAARFTEPALWDDAAMVGGQWHALGRQRGAGTRLVSVKAKTGEGRGQEKSFSMFPYVTQANAVGVICGLEWGPRRHQTVLSLETFKSFAQPWAAAVVDGRFLRPACLANAHAVALQPDHTLFAVVPAASGAVEAQVWKRGKLVATHAMALGEWPLDRVYPACARDGAFYVAVGPLLARCRLKEGFDFEADVVDFGEPIVGLAVAPAPFPHRVLVAAGARAVLVDPEKGFAMHDLYRDPRGNALLGAVFTQDGHAVPVGTQGAAIHRAGETIEPAGRVSGVHFPPDTEFAALVPLEESASFAYLTRDGNFGAIRPA